LNISGDVVEIVDAALLYARFRLDPQIDGLEPLAPFTPRRR